MITLISIWRVLAIDAMYYANEIRSTEDLGADIRKERLSPASSNGARPRAAKRAARGRPHASSQGRRKIA